MKKRFILVTVSVFFLCLTSYSQVVSLSFSSGIFLPSEEIYRDIYGQSMPLAMEVRIGIGQSFGLAAGIEYLSDKGTALNINQGDDEFPLRFRMISYPISGYFVYPHGRISLSAAAGISIHSYKEEWEDLDHTHEGSRTNPFLSGRIEYHIAPRLAAHLFLRYESIATELNPLIQKEINLGGFSLLAGLSVRIL